MIKNVAGFAYDCKNADALADFYVRLLGWKKEFSAEGWAGLRSPQGWILAFQELEDYVPPVWPWENGSQQQQAHMDFELDCPLEEGVTYAISCGARKAEVQYFETSTVMLDPEGHPFCLTTVGQ